MAKKVCIVTPSAYPLLTGDRSIASAGGAEAQLSIIGRSLADKGYEVHFVVDDFGQPKQVKLGNIWIHKSPLRYMGGNNLHLPPDWLYFIKVLWQIDADYHIIKLPRNLLVPLGGFCRLKKSRLIFVGQIDNDIDLDFIRNNEGRITYYLYRAGIRFVDYIVAQNEKQREGFQRLFGKRTRIIKSVVTLPNATEVSKKNYVLWVGTSLAKKQPDKFLDLAERLPDIDFKMIVAPADRAIESQLRKRAENIPNLDYLGFIPLADIWRYFSEAKLFVSTSLREGFPNTFLQSWQYETPVVSLNVDPDNVISDLGLGRLSGSFETMCNDIKSMMNDPGLRAEYGLNAKHYVENNHSNETIISQYIEVLEDL